MPCFAATPLSSSQYALLSAALARSMTRPSQLGSCTPTKPHSFAHLHMSLKFCRCGPLPANCARKIAGPLIVFMSDRELRQVVGRFLRRLEDRLPERRFLFIEERLRAVRLRGADD